MDYMFLFNLTLFNSKQKANSKTFKQKTWQKSYKIQIKTLANPGLAKSGFEELALCLFAIVLHRISLKAQNDYNKISCRSFAEAFLCKTPCATIRLLDERVSVFEHWTSHLAFIDIHHTLPSSCLECTFHRCHEKSTSALCQRGINGARKRRKTCLGGVLKFLELFLCSNYSLRQ